MDERTPVLEMREEDFCPGDERILAYMGEDSFMRGLLFCGEETTPVLEKKGFLS